MGSPFGMKKVAPAIDVYCVECGAQAGALCKWTSGPKAGLTGKQRCCKGRRRAADDKRTREVREAKR